MATGGEAEIDIASECSYMDKYSLMSEDGGFIWIALK